VESTHCPELIEVTERPEAVMVRGEGSYLWDQAQVRYLDFVQGWAVNSLGHCPPEVANALAVQAQTLLTPSPAYHNFPQIQLARRLARLSGLPHVTFGNSGADAVESAIKVCRKWGRLRRGGAHEIITTDGAFHGRTLAAMAASGKPAWDRLFPPYPSGFRRVAYGSLDAVREVVSDRTVAIMVEPLQGEAGAVEPEPGYLQGLRELTHRHDLLLVFDEVQTGMGRTGSLFAGQGQGVLPDVMTLGKGLGGGVPISATLVNDRAHCLASGDTGGTFFGNPLCTAAALAVLDVVATPWFLDQVRQRGARLRQGLKRISDTFGGKVRGSGLLLGLVLDWPGSTAVRDRCFELGLLVNAAQPSVLRFMPSLRVSDQEVDLMLATLSAALTDVSPIAFKRSKIAG